MSLTANPTSPPVPPPFARSTPPPISQTTPSTNTTIQTVQLYTSPSDKIDESVVEDANVSLNYTHPHPPLNRIDSNTTDNTTNSNGFGSRRPGRVYNKSMSDLSACDNNVVKRENGAENVNVGDESSSSIIDYNDWDEDDHDTAKSPPKPAVAAVATNGDLKLDSDSDDEINSMLEELNVPPSNVSTATATTTITTATTSAPSASVVNNEIKPQQQEQAQVQEQTPQQQQPQQPQKLMTAQEQAKFDFLNSSSYFDPSASALVATTSTPPPAPVPIPVPVYVPTPLAREEINGNSTTIKKRKCLNPALTSIPQQSSSSPLMSSSILSKKPCLNLRCTKCNFVVLRFDSYSFRKGDGGVDYMFFRENYPSFDKMVTGMVRNDESGESVAYCCQCNWLSLSSTSEGNEVSVNIKNTNGGNGSLRWVCTGC